MNAEELAREAHCMPRLAEPLLDACAAMGLLHREGGSCANAHIRPSKATNLRQTTGLYIILRD